MNREELSKTDIAGGGADKELALAARDTPLATAVILRETRCRYCERYLSCGSSCNFDFGERAQLNDGSTGRRQVRL